MPWYENRGAEPLWYEEEGSGCPVVLLHGWCMSSAVWTYQLSGLAGSFRILAPDLRGHGRSRDVAGSFDFDAFSSDLVDLFDRLELSRAVLVGWSMGAQIALRSYEELSGRLAGMVLVSATPCFTATGDFPYGLPKAEADGMRLKVQRSTQRALAGFHTRLFAERELEINPLAPDITRLLSAIPLPDTAAALEALDALAGTDMRHLLAAISVPTLVVHGAADRICLPQASSYLKERIAGAEQIVFPDCGHAPFLLYSQRFNAELIRFARSACE